MQFKQKLFFQKDTKENEIKNIMKPPMNARVDKLFIIFQILFEDWKEDEYVKFYKLLTLDFSPCIQKKIINTLYNYLNNKRIHFMRRKNIF